MNTRLFSSGIATLLVTALIVPSVFFIAPQRAQALFGVGDIVHDPINYIQNTITAVASVSSDIANVAMKVNAYFLQPLAFVLSGEILKLVTAGVISFVIGEANGTGIPQFVVDVQKSLQTVGDLQALSFFEQYQRNSNSPFSGSIIASLRNDYLSKTSLAGFWAQNINTLAASTPSYAPGYLTGNWSQGGIHAWFALTTETQNNPYTLYQKSQAQLAGVIGKGPEGAIGARVEELAWGNGFMSWCGEFGESYNPNDTQVAGLPGDDCVKKDGTHGTVKTPGTVIVETLNRELGTEHDTLVRLGNVGPQINDILNNIGTVMQTVNFATSILGGKDSGGLSGVNKTSGTNATPRLLDYQNSPGYLGATTNSVYQNEIGTSLLPTAQKNLEQYETAWNILNNAANTAFTVVTDLKDFCSAHIVSVGLVQTEAAQNTLDTVIAPTLASLASASTKIAAARASLEEAQFSLEGGFGETTLYTNNIQNLQTTAITAEDLATAKAESQVLGFAEAAPEGSLNVAGGSLLDRLQLITANATALKENGCRLNTP